MSAPDPRPLTGEPVSLDLLNTRWMHDGERQDLLASADGLAVWLAATGLDARFPADEAALGPLLRAREALLRAVESPGDPAATADVDAILEHGRIRATLSAEGPGEQAEFADPAWGPPGRPRATTSTCCAPRRTGSAPAPMTRASCTSSTSRGTGRAAGAR